MALKTFSVTLTVSHIDGVSAKDVKNWNWQAMVGYEDPDIAVDCTLVQELAKTPKKHLIYYTR